MDEDERFKHLASDPRFKALPRKKQEVEEDERFKCDFVEEPKDKRGHDYESDVSSSSDESTDEEWEDNEVIYDWKPLDDDAEKTDSVYRRLAIQNLDWDHLDAKDIFTLVNSVRPPLSVRIYISEFGKERLAREMLEGPAELAEQTDEEEEEEFNRLEEKLNPKLNEYEDADEMIDSKNEKLRERIRRYQLSKMKYYYAIVEFDSCESAEIVYKELDGLEYEGSSLELDLRFVPDDIEFSEEDIKSECNKAPDLATYKAPQFINSALQQTNVRLTWDETDVKRQNELRKAHTKEELEKNDLEAYLASETESDDQDDEARANKYKTLLESLEDEEEEKKKVDVDVRWDEESFEDRRREKRRDDKEDDKRENEQDDNGFDLLMLDVNSREKTFKFDPDDGRFKAIYESGLYNIDPSHPSFKRTEAVTQIAERKRIKRNR